MTHKSCAFISLVLQSVKLAGTYLDQGKLRRDKKPIQEDERQDDDGVQDHDAR